MIEQFHEDNIPVDNLITLVRDGPNVNKAIMRKIEQTIKGEHPEFKGFVDLGSCVLHAVHNGFGKGLEMYGKDMISYAWIFMPSSSTVLRGERTTISCRPTYELILRPSSSTQKFVG